MKSRILLIPQGVPRMRRFIVGFFAVIGILVVLAAVGGALAWRFLAPKAPVIAASTILDLDLTRGLAKSPSQDVFGQLLFEEHLALRDGLDPLQRAAAA